MSFSSSPYTDLILPTPNEDNSTYGTILNTYFQALETKLKNLSDRINAAGVGSSSTLAQINRDIAQTDTNTSGILPDPYSGDFTTVSTWPAFNAELTALGLSPPQTASEIEAFFSGSDFTSFVNFLNGKLTALDTLVSTAETDICIANKYSDRVLNYEDYLTWTQTASSTLGFYQGRSNFGSGTYTNYCLRYPTCGGSGYASMPPASGGVIGTAMITGDLPATSGYSLADVGTTIVKASHPDISFSSGSTVTVTGSFDVGAQHSEFNKITFSIDSTWNGNYQGIINYNGAYGSLSYGDQQVWTYQINCVTYTLSLPAPDTSTC